MIAHKDRYQPTHLERTERVEFCCALLAQGLSGQRVAAAFRKHYGNSAPNTISRYVAKARDKLVREAARDTPNMRAESYAFYQAFAADLEKKDTVRLNARERLDKLMGLDIGSAASQHLHIHGEAALQRIDQILGIAGLLPQPTTTSVDATPVS